MSAVERAVQFANPVTGEVLTLASPDEDLVSYLNDLKEYRSVLEEHRRMVGRELISRLDRSAKWTRHVGGFKLSVPSPAPVEEWDGAELREALLRFVDENFLSIEAVDAAVEVVVSYKTKKAGIQALRKLPRVGDVIEELRREIPKTDADRNVRIERA